MNENNWIVKILLTLPLLLSFILGINALAIGILKMDLIGMISNSFQMMFIAYIVVGISTIIMAVILGIKIFKRT